MEKSKFTPFLRFNLDILFVGLNPANGSSNNGHYFSVNQAFWNQLYASGLIGKQIDKWTADDIIFATNDFNYNNWNYGITDLVTQYAESDSNKIKPTIDNCKKLKTDIQSFKPKVVILLHGKVIKNFLGFVKRQIPLSNSGALGKLITNCDTEFFNIAFPHGNAINSDNKIKRYIEVKMLLLKNTDGSGKLI